MEEGGQRKDEGAGGDPKTDRGCLGNWKGFPGGRISFLAVWGQEVRPRNNLGRGGLDQAISAEQKDRLQMVVRLVEDA